MRIITDIYKDGRLYESANGYFEEVIDTLTESIGFDSESLDLFEDCVSELWGDIHNSRTFDVDEFTIVIRRN